MNPVGTNAFRVSAEGQASSLRTVYPLLFGSILILLLLASGWVQAHTATRFFDVQVVDLPEVGPALKVQGVLVLRNQFKDESFVVRARVAERYGKGQEKVRMISGEKVKIAPGGALKLPFRFELVGDGKHRAILQLDVFSPGGGVQVGHQPVDLYFKVKQGQYQRSSYQDLYMPKQVVKPDTSRPQLLGKTVEVAKDAYVKPLPEGVTGVLGAERLKLRALPEPKGTGNQGKHIVPKNESGTRSTPGVNPKILRKEGSSFVVPEDPSSTESFWASLLDGLFIKKAHAFGPGPSDTYTVSGRFSYRGLDNNLHPGWNWFVQLWWRKSNGDWEKLASRYIPSSGNWSLSFSKSGYSGQQLLIQYRAGSYFIMPQDQNNNPYWWSDPEQTNIPTSFDIGHRVADTSSSGTVAGLGDVHNSAYLYWWKFTSNGINPERSDPIRLFFPNTWENCGGTSPWSCASTGGDIWLIAAHAENYTIQHELAHQTNNEFWNNERPDGAGGAHTITNCYNDGLALREGFANAVPHWVLDGENSNNPTAAGWSFSLESPPAADVCNGDTNEVWVAAVFWDLLDRRSDGDDILYFNNAAEVFGIYLNAGVKDGIKNYRTNYRNAASSGHEGFIDDIYEHNTIPVP